MSNTKLKVLRCLNHFMKVRNFYFKILTQSRQRYHAKSKRMARMQKQIQYLSVIDFNDNKEGDIIRSEFFGELYKTLNSLPKECRKVFNMLYIQGKSVSEIADELNLSPSTIKTQKTRGLAVLKKKLFPKA